MSLVLATCADLPQLDIDDQLLYGALRDAGIPVDIAIWDDSAVEWSQYEFCVIRSTWDYVPKRKQYLSWVDHVALQTNLWNPAPLIHWNTDKTYLKTLQNQGVPIVETHWLPQGSSIHFSDFFQTQSWRDIVVKPVVSASGKDTFRINATNLPDLENTLQILLAKQDLMVQPFMHSIKTTGELSFLFFNGEFSHGVQKVPASTDFRVQEHLGGTSRLFQPTVEQCRFAEQVLQHLPWSALYARVDVMTDEQGQLCLSELELTEPSMFLAYEPEAAWRFAQAIQQKLK